MIIAVAGPYSAESNSDRLNNLKKLNQAGAELIKLGHVPIIGVNAALPIIEFLDVDDKYNIIMDISMAIIANCDALYYIGSSPGANRERDLFITQNKPVFNNLSEIKSLEK